MLDDEWKNPLKSWHNAPVKKVSIKDDKITLRVPAGTDCWRKTRQGMISKTVNNAPFYWQKVSGDFQCLVKVSGHFRRDHDKAGLMVQFDDDNDDHWILTGLEFVGNTVVNSTAVSMDHTDWSMTELPPPSAAEQHSSGGWDKDGLWCCFKRRGNCFECFYSTDGRKWVQTRQGTFTERPVVLVGLAGAGTHEFKVTFESYKCSNSSFM